MTGRIFPTSRMGWITAALALSAVLVAVILLVQPRGDVDAAVPPYPRQQTPQGQEPGTGQEQQVRVMHYNMCGAAEGCPWNAGGSGSGTSIDRIVREAADFTPDVISLNEICKGQYQALLRRLDSLGNPMDGLFGEAQNNVGNCGSGGSFGAAVLVRKAAKKPVTENRRYSEDGGETYTGRGRTVAVRRGLLCLTTRLDDGRLLKACTTHANAMAPEQIAELREWTDDEESFPQAVPTLIAGDLNQQPNAEAMTHLYESRFFEADDDNREWFTKGSTGGVVCRPEETDRCRNGAPTADERKIDYIFADARHFTRARPTEVTTFPESDHAMMKARFTLLPAM
ncbi:endonuclease/exonuclease/phosphatase family protein [Streptomyces sp. NPDC056773]|uniref:endonuclease/exonuclease/phosphatase family protein n=1 Tax=unclassified Streptomyces TaxID=2593676 RepID=UPI0036AE3D87